MMFRFFKKLKPKALFRAVSAWDSAGHGKRLSYWNPGDSSINSLLHGQLDVLRNRSRDVVRKNPFASNILDTIVANCVGTGIKPQPKIADSALKKKLQSLWLSWTDEADFAGVSDFYGLQSTVLRAVAEAGECFIKFCINKASKTVPLQLQVLESEHLDSSKDYALPNGNVIKSGIEFNRSGKRVAYHVFKEHPGDSHCNESIRVPASEILHIYKVLRPGQIRGEPWLARVLLKLYELDQYDDAELVRKKTAAMFAGFVTRADPEDNVLIEQGENGNFAGLEPGTMQFLDPGEDVKFTSPSDVGGNYEAFMRQQLRSIAVGVGLTYEQLTSDLTEVNYSSIRAGLIEFRRKAAQIQHHLMVYQFCRPVWNRWIELAQIAGILGASDELLNVKWVPQGWDWVDPLKDQEAQKVAVRNGFKSRSEVVSEYGYDAEEIDDEIKKDNARADEIGVIFDSDSRSRAASSRVSYSEEES
jgi:lambda family phage portal protein